MPSAARRNAVPEALLVPASLFDEPGPVWHHAIHYHERSSFTPSSSCESRGGLYTRIDESSSSSVVLDQSGEALKATFTWNMTDCGQPRRSPPTSELILKLGDWGRFAFNGRHVGETGNWYYTKVIVNLLYGTTTDCHCFAGQPTFEIRCLERLR